MSPTIAIELVRKSALGITDYKEYLFKITASMVTCAVYIIISVLLFRRIDRKTRIDGTLGVS